MQLLTAEQLNDILNFAGDAVICTDARQNIIFFNQGAERVFGWEAREILGKELGQLLPARYRATHPQKVEQFRASAHVSRRMAERQIIHALRKDGSEFPAEASISKLQGAEGWIYTAILRDLSARRTCARTSDKAELAMQTQSLSRANMSHEIRTPLNAVIGMTSLLLNTEIDAEQREYAETIRDSSEMLLSLINDLIDYSKIEIGSLEIARQPLDLRRCIEETMDLLASGASVKGIDLAYMMEEDVPATILADAARLRQILVNLLSNAVKFTDHGEVVVTVSASLLESGEHLLRFSVRDTGIGIPQDRLEGIFQSLVQMDASAMRKLGGTGLGLAISKRLTEIMGGTMSVESKPGMGSTFTFSIVAQAEGEQLAQHLLQDRASAFAGKRVLIVNANGTNRRILVNQAFCWGMVPSAAASAGEALDLVRHGHAFDIGILDMNMPEMDGMQLATEIRQYRDAKSLPLVMLTPASHRSCSPAAPDVQFAACLNKPIKPSALFKALQQALEIPVAAQSAPSGTKNEPESKIQPGLEPKLAATLPLDILVAEDNTINQKVIKQLLLHLGYRADVVANGLEALAAAERRDYDVILMDVQMPEMDGLETTRRLRALSPGATKPYIIAMTANAMPGDKEACMAAGMNAYVSKPVELDDIRQVLASVRTHEDSSASPHAVAIINWRRIGQLLELQDEENPSLFADVISSFIDDAPHQLDRIAHAIAEGCGAKLAAAAHYFLSSIDFLGAQRMRAPCMELARMGRQNDLADATALLEQLRREFELARGRLLEMLER
ncbi:MAG TPA: hybrid sensor histidine kinase/response regulator [Oxalobacteraceae bacterium]|nr:hybrid sensor histidine kinase/response regulator [Oxalobacteraceae bacterium]